MLRRQSVNSVTRALRVPYCRWGSTLAEARRRWNGRLVVTEEVEHALESGQAVVALESTIITHGMPHPTNLTTALSVEQIVRSQGAIPATVALLDGKVYVGLDRSQLESLADPSAPHPNGPPVKVSRRDFGPTLAMKRVGGTTVAGTMLVASSVGIKSFVTGGIGGVHRGGENSMDVSADLIELGRTPMMVVCAGAKSILDIPRTLEFLETQGVCVASYNDTGYFPAFYTPSSGHKSPWNVDNVHDAASLVYAGLSLPSPVSTLFGVPIPPDHQSHGDVVQQAVEQAVRESVEQGIDKRGKEVTPWLLARVGQLTKGIALDLNVKLIENNALIGSQIAVEMSRLARESSSATVSSSTSGVTRPATEPKQPEAVDSNPTLPPPTVLVFGSAAIDLTSTTTGPLVPGTTTPGSVFVSPGGVGRNIAEAAQSLLPSGQVMLVSAVGGKAGLDTSLELDALGQLLKLELANAKMRTDGLVPTRSHATSVCSLVLDQGDLVGGVADMNIVETITPPTAVERIETTKPRMVVLDCNLLPETIAAILSTCAKQGIPTLCDPTSVPKLDRLVGAIKKHPRALAYLCPNEMELNRLYALLTADESEPAWEFVNALDLGAQWRASVEALARDPGRSWIRTNGIATKMVALLPWIGGFWVKAGAAGVVHLRFQRQHAPSANSVAHKVPSGPRKGEYLILTHYPPPKISPEEIVSTTGAGDTLVGGIVAGLTQDEAEATWMARAIERVGATLRSPRAVA